MLNSHFSELVILYFRKKKIEKWQTYFSPFSAQESSPPQICLTHFSFPSNTNHCFFGPLQFPVQRKATIILLPTHPDLQMRNLSVFHHQPTLEQAAVYFCSSVTELFALPSVGGNSSPPPAKLPRVPFQNGPRDAARLPWGFQKASGQIESV